MTLRRRSIALTLVAVGLGACARPPARLQFGPFATEALVSETSIRARCVDPEGVIAGRVLCVLRDDPADSVMMARRVP